jgi:hypothetical protein
MKVLERKHVVEMKEMETKLEENLRMHHEEAWVSAKQKVL